ncbi:hypothetical protein GQ600_23083 [Phytophthora cactorum]|nr:hypothetical protein GQ600_23083 [Phytophthora cactorum]
MHTTPSIMILGQESALDVGVSIVVALLRQRQRDPISSTRSTERLTSQSDVVDLAVSDDESKSDDDEVPKSASTESEVTETPSQALNRLGQHVSTIQQLKRVIAWMEDYMKSSGKKNMFARPSTTFRSYSTPAHACKLKQSHLLVEKAWTFTETSRGTVGISTRRETGRKRINAKALQGRGRRRSEWVN